MKTSPLLATLAVGTLLTGFLPAQTINVLNPSFESNTNPNPGYGAVDNWAFLPGGNSGVSTQAQSFLNQPAHDGSQAAFIQSGGTFAQTISSFDASKLYTVTYFVSERGQSGASTTTSVSLDGGASTYAESDTILKTDAFRRIVSGPLAVSGSSSSLEISAANGPGDDSLLIDSVSVSRAVPRVPDGGFENPVQPNLQWGLGNGGGSGSLVGTLWDFGGSPSGITDNGSAFAPPAAPDGSQAAILRGTSTISTTVDGFEAGVTYSLTVEAAARAGTPNDFQVRLDGVLLIFGGLTDLDPLVGSYTTYTSDGFVTSGGSFQLSFTGLVGGDRTAFLDDIRFNFVAEAETVDTTPPEIVLTTPTDDATAVEPDTNLVATFSEVVTTGTGSITLYNVTDASIISTIAATDTQVTISANTLTIDPVANLPYSKKIAVWIDTATVFDTTGNAFSGYADTTTWNFTVRDQDLTSPSLVSLAPADNAELAPAFANLVAVFDEPIAAGSGLITIKNLTDATSSTIAVTDGAQVSISGDSLRIDPATEFETGKAYAVQIAAGAVVDQADVPNAYGGISNDTDWNFSIGTFTQIYSDDFSGANGVNLFGTTADVANAHNGVPAGSPWSGSTLGFDADGSVDGGEGNRGVWVPFQPAAGRVYVLSGTIDTTAGGSDWITLGFATGNPDNNFNTVAANPYGSILIRENRGPSAAQTFPGVILAGAKSVDTFSGPIPVDIVLDASDANSANWTVEFFLGGTSLRGPDSVASGNFGNINYVGFSKSATSAGTIADFALTFADTSGGGGGNDFSDWIAGFPGVGGQTGVGDDPDGDGQESGVENFFGTDPDAFSQGIEATEVGPGTFKFVHPENATPADDLTAAYTWSKTLVPPFNADGATDGDGTKVEFTTEANTPAPGLTTVTATVSGTATNKLYVRVEVTQN